jgi:predicted PurR-regulated permease PerM
MLETSWTTERIFRLGAFAILILTCVQILAPFLGALTWAAIMAMTVWPAFVWIGARLGNRHRLAATLVSLALALILVLPFTVLVASLRDGVHEVAAVAKDLTALTLPEPPAWLTRIPVLGDDFEEAWRKAAMDMAGLLQAAQPAIKKAALWALAQGAQLGLALLEFLLAIIIAGMLLVTADRSAQWTRRFMDRLQIENSEKVIQVVVSTVRGVSLGQVGTSFLEAVLAAIGLFIAGVPGVVLLAFLTFLAAAVQIPPLLIVIAPAALWLYFQGEGGWSLFLIIWAVVTIVPVDNFLRPYLISREAKLPLALIFLGVIGGILAWGMIGLFIGPTLLAVTFSLLRTWVGAERT